MRHLGAIVAAARRNPLTPWCPLPTQERFLSSRAHKRLLRAGNQWGKTTAGAIDAIAHASGVPWHRLGALGTGAERPLAPEDLTTPFPIEAWVFCASWSQSVAVQSKLHALIPSTLRHPEDVFDETQGYSPIKSPIVRIRHATGGWSTIRIKTTNQGGLRISSATIQYLWFDEPPPSTRIYTEALKRLQRAGRIGRMILTMTPVNAEVGWLEAIVGTGAIEDHHARMEPEEFKLCVRVSGAWRPGPAPVRLADGTPCDAAWIARMLEETPEHERPVVCHGEWRMAPEGAVFGAFRTSGARSHVTDARPTGHVTLMLGIDHGVREYTQVAVLIAADAAGVVWVLDEYVGQTETTDDDDAEGILAMLERNEVRWAELDEVFGDRAHYGTARGPSVAAKSNGRLATALKRHDRARRHGIPGSGELAPAIRRAKSGVSHRPGSVEYGCAWLHRAMVGDRFRVARRCEKGIASIIGYDGRQNSPESHWLDALRYGLRTRIWRSEGARPAPRIRVV